MSNANIPQRPAAMFISHGGGPLPVLGDPGHSEMVEHLGDIAAQIDKPSTIIVVSAHWEESEVTITAGSMPPVIYDYYGFPRGVVLARIPGARRSRARFATPAHASEQ